MHGPRVLALLACLAAAPCFGATAQGTIGIEIVRRSVHDVIRITVMEPHGP